MSFDAAFVTQLLVGNLAYLLLIISMVMTRMLWLRLFAIGSGIVGTAYTFFWLNDLVSTFWEAVFTLVNIVQVTLITYRNMRANFTADERAFYDAVVASLEPHQARKLMRIGSWRDADAGFELTRQGVVVPHLYFIKSGEVTVLVDGTPIGIVRSGSLIGEISIATGDPATATVTANGPIHYLALERRALHKLMSSDPEIERAIEDCNRRNLRDKLVQMNVAAVDRS
jgi:CRP-like cAMP-binding protein